MRPFLLLIVCLIALPAIHAQSAGIAPVQVAAGRLLTFHLQTRLKPTEGDALDALPRGTAVHVMMLDSIDSGVNRDGDSFQAVVVSPLVSGGMVVIHSDAKARGVLALLRSQSHPEGFRYALLLTGLTDHGQSFVLTASMDSLSADAVATKDPDRTQPLAASN